MQETIINNFLDFMGLKYTNEEDRKIIKDILLKYSEERSYKVGEQIFKENNEATQIFYIDNGELRIQKYYPKMKKDVTMYIVNDKHLIGSSALINGHKYMLSSIASKDTFGLIIKKDFIDYIYKNETLSSSFLKFILETHKNENMNMLEIVSKSEKNRLIKYLKDYDENIINFDEHQLDIVNILKIKKINIKKVIKELEDENIIENIKNNTYKINNLL